MLICKNDHLIAVTWMMVLFAALAGVAQPSLAATNKKNETAKASFSDGTRSKRLGPQAQTVDVSGFFDVKKPKPKTKRVRAKPDTVAGADFVIDGVEDLNDRPPIEKLMGYINRARLALAVNNHELAVQHINRAVSECAFLKDTSPQPMITHIKIGNFLYSHGKHLADYYYFPVGSELQEWQNPHAAPFWAQQGGLGVRDVQLAHVMITINADDVSSILKTSKQAIADNRKDQAQDILTRLNNKIATTEKSEELPLTKAKDNVVLANYFLVAGNYEASRNALRHARDGLNDARKKEHDQANRQNLDLLSQEIQKTEKQLQAKNPTLLGDASAQLEDWWNRLNQWSGTED